MSLPKDHSCDSDCDPKDEDHRELRRTRPGCDTRPAPHATPRARPRVGRPGPRPARPRQQQKRAKLRAEVQADQAWATARDMLPELHVVKKKLDAESSLTPEDLEIMNKALSLVLGEVYLRKAQSLENIQDA